MLTEQGRSDRGGTGTYRGLSRPLRAPPCTEPPSARGLPAGNEPSRGASTSAGRRHNRRRPDASALQPRGLLLAPTQATPRHATTHHSLSAMPLTLAHTHTHTVAQSGGQGGHKV